MSYFNNKLIMKKHIILIITLFTINFANGQWVQSGLGNNPIEALIVNNNKIYAGTYSYGLYCSSDNGVNWYSVTDLGTTNIASLKGNGEIMLAGIGCSDNIFLSQNSGSNWNWVYNTSGAIFSFAISEDNIYAGSGSGKVYRSTNRGTSWTVVNNGLPVVYFIKTVAISGNNIFVGGVKGIYLSTDNGNNWISVNNGLTDSNITSLLIKDSNIFAGTNTKGVFLSKNNGLSWTNVSNGLCSCSIFFDVMTVIRNEYIFIGTSNGVYLSNNDGNNWIYTGLSNDNIQSLAFDSINIYAGTWSHGVWKCPLSNFGINSSINEINKNINLELYPNPTKENLTIETNSNTNQSLEIINIVGQTIYTSTFSKKTTIDVSRFPKGVYILKIINKDKESIVKKFIKE